MSYIIPHFFNLVSGQFRENYETHYSNFTVRVQGNILYYSIRDNKGMMWINPGNTNNPSQQNKVTLQDLHEGEARKRVRDTNTNNPEKVTASESRNLRKRARNGRTEPGEAQEIPVLSRESSIHQPMHKTRNLDTCKPTWMAYIGCLLFSCPDLPLYFIVEVAKREQMPPTTTG